MESKNFVSDFDSTGYFISNNVVNKYKNTSEKMIGELLLINCN